MNQWIKFKKIQGRITGFGTVHHICFIFIFIKKKYTSGQPIFKFWILKDNYVRTNNTAGLSGSLPRSSGIKLKWGPSHIIGFINYISYIFEKTLVFFKCIKRYFSYNWRHLVVTPILGFIYYGLQNTKKESSFDEIEKKGKKCRSII
jgi:hypothetical protein